MALTFSIPETITVHLGRPQASAANVTVPFTDYIKNVASSEIYPTWPESAIRANIYAQISIALNRIFTEYYRSRGYNFDITNSTQYDQSFVYGRDYFSNISEIVDNIFNSYVVRRGRIEPYFTEYCDGVNVTCRGLSQWGTVDLANQGYTPYEILQYYYGNDIDIVQGRVGSGVQSYPGRSLSIGATGGDVITIQSNLNRISKNYPLIPTITNPNGVYDVQTENAVKTFQRIFNLTPDGVVGMATWYQIRRVFFAIKQTNELFSEGITITDEARRFLAPLSLGASGNNVRAIQFYLRVLSYFIPQVPQIAVDGIFGPATENAVKSFQSYVGLNPDGIVGRATWNAIINQYDGIEKNLQTQYAITSLLPAPGYSLTIGSRGDDVRLLQENINTIARSNPSVPTVPVDGIYGEQTANAVRQIQRLDGLDPTGSVGPLTWNAIISRIFDISRFIG